ncbi:Mut7-C RNAse domain-containing protein [Halogranum rubrum]|uniref:Mut7-C RNAse domain-containing protein n=1 Tax=Halogranum salarium B-1 TaxID=1210908 RepID=J3JH29_9EURY|nr:Mut7-C RNAse domain-containing protein [Halogranum salarium]EJN60626.1 hypothetical protein HSB1_12290 [Halogranum salarium B-1]
MGADETADERPRLLLDVMLGKLATYLRMCGYDTMYALDEGVEGDDRLLELAEADGRVLLTRDRQLAGRADDAVLLTERDVEDQLCELRDAGFSLTLDDTPTFCGRCNGPLDSVGGEESETTESTTPRPDYAPDDRPLWRCRECGQFFWKGSHWTDVEARLKEL